MSPGGGISPGPPSIGPGSPIESPGGISPGGGPSPNAVSTLSPAASNASCGLIPASIAVSKPS